MTAARPRGQDFVMVVTCLQKFRWSLEFVSLKHGKQSRPATCRPEVQRKRSLICQHNSEKVRNHDAVRTASITVGPRFLRLNTERPRRLNKHLSFCVSYTVLAPAADTLHSLSRQVSECSHLVAALPLR